MLVLALASPAMLVLLVTGNGSLRLWGFALAAAVLPGALIALAAGRRAGWAAAALTALLVAGVALMLALAGGGRVGGLPGSAWAMFGAFWGWPLIVTVWAYAASFRYPGPEPPGGGEP